MSEQRRSARKRAANTRFSDLPHSSPTQKSQPAPKRRKANAPPRARNARRHQTPEENDDVEDDLVDNDTEDEEQDHELSLTDKVMQYLDVAPEPVAAAEEHKSEIWNDYGKDIQAYANVSGRNWTYYVTDPRILFGRNLGPDAKPDPQEAEVERVQIDLRPNNKISRKHAEISYDHAEEYWRLIVHGRNGVKVNEDHLKKDETKRLHSGDIIGIAGTQMLFQLANQSMTIPDFFLDKMNTIQEQHVNVLDGNSRKHRGMDPPAVSGGNNRYEPVPALPYPTPIDRTKTPEPTPKPEPSSRKKRSPYNRGVVMESTEQIDYSLDTSKDIKPPLSYATMITFAILSTSDEAISLSDIYEYLRRHYAHYRATITGWQNSIRHQLSLNKNFVKVARGPNEPGKGMKWTFVPDTREMTIEAAYKNSTKRGGRNNSTPASPTKAPAQGGFAVHSADGTIKSSPSNKSPAMSTYPLAQQEAATPTHSSRHHLPAPTYGPTKGELPILSDDTSPPLRRFNNSHLLNRGSSPTLTSGTLHSADYPMQTPAPRAHNLAPPQPNTIRHPTNHMTPNTPAPFWKHSSVNGGISTPDFRFPESSPVKFGGATAPLSSSPPPMIGNDLESPTRKSGFSQQRTSTSFGASGQNGNIAPSSSDGYPSVSIATSPPAEDQEADGIDILKGFTRIDKFHADQQRNSLPSAGAP